MAVYATNDNWINDATYFDECDATNRVDRSIRTPAIKSNNNSIAPLLKASNDLLDCMEDINNYEQNGEDMSTHLNQSTAQRGETNLKQLEMIDEIKLSEFVSYQSYQSYLGVSSLADNKCVLLNTSEGRRLFIEALRCAYMESYFTISSQIENQTEYTCGQTTLVVALNSLGIDPGRPAYYDEWRWHCLETLSCWTSRGGSCSNITKEQFTRLAICNDGRAFSVTVDNTDDVCELRNWIKLCTGRQDVLMVANYDRKTLGQVGLGHYLPVLGYHEGEDMILMGEIAKHKYPLYWVRLEHLVEAMKTLDSHTGKNRGFIVMTQPDYTPSLKIFELPDLFALDNQTTDECVLAKFTTKWRRWLDTTSDYCDNNNDENDFEIHILTESINQLLSSIMMTTNASAEPFSMVSIIPIAFRYHQKKDGHSSIVARCQKPHEPHCCPNYNFILKLESTFLFQTLQQVVIPQIPQDQKKVLLELVSVPYENIDEALHHTKTKFMNLMKIEGRPLPPITHSMRGYLKRDSEFSSYQVDNSNSRNSNCDYKIGYNCPGFIQILPEHIAALFLLTWPYLTDDEPYIHDEITIDRMKAEIIPTIQSSTSPVHESDSTCNNIKAMPIVSGEQTTKTKTENPRNVASYLHEIVCRDMCVDNGTGSLNHLEHAVKSLNRKLRVTLKYQNLL